MKCFFVICNVVTITNAFIYKFCNYHSSFTYCHTNTHTHIYLSIWYFGEIFQATSFRKEFFNHIIIVCHLFLQQALCEIWEK